MKWTLSRLAVLLLLVTLVAAVPVFGWPRYLKHAEDSALQSVARHSREITAVEVLRLSPDGETGAAGSYLVHYDDSRRGIDVRHTVTGAGAAELGGLWGRVRFAEGYLAACHEPGFALRFFSGHRSIFEVAVCFECDNVSWQPLPFTTSCRQMYPTLIDPKSGTDALKTFLTQLQ